MAVRNADPAMLAIVPPKHSPRDSPSPNVTSGMNNSGPLSRVLKSWQHDPAPSPDFNKAVWACIDAPEQIPAPSFLAQLFHFPRQLPLTAGFAILLAAFAGTGAALSLGHGQSTDRMAAAYVRSIDPLQMTDTSPASHASHS